MKIQLHGVYLTADAAVQAADAAGGTAVRITPNSAREWYALALDQDLVFPCTDRVTGIRYTRVYASLISRRAG